MDFSRRENEKEVIRKLSNTANKIRKNRKNKIKLNKEIQEFQEIKDLLNVSDSESTSAEERECALKESSYSLSSCTIPLCAPGTEVIQEEKVFSYFNKETLNLKDFLEDNVGHCIFGKDAEIPDEDLFRTLIIFHIAETSLPKDGKCHSIGLYVLYLLSVHTDEYFVSACADFLKQRRFEIGAAEILPIFTNFGCSFECLFDSVDVFNITTKFRRQDVKSNGGYRFPYYNAHMVANIILHYAKLDLIKKDAELKLLVKGLTRLTLDRKIRSSRLLPLYSLLISVLSSQLAQVYDVGEVVSCLHLENEHILNQLEVSKIIHMPISSKLHESLIIKTINFILKTDVLTVRDKFKVKYVLSVLEELKEKDLTPLEVYCILQLINGSLPRVTATTLEAGDISKLLVCLEARFFKVKDSIDLIRLKLEIAKLRNLVVNSVEKVFSVNYLNDITL